MKHLKIILLILCLAGSVFVFLYHYCFKTPELYLVNEEETEIEGLRTIDSKKVEVIEKKMGEERKYHLIVDDGNEKTEVINFPDDYQEEMYLLKTRPAFGKTLEKTFGFFLLCVGASAIIWLIVRFIDSTDPALALD